MDVERAENQLNLVLSFFSRVETKSSFLFAVNIGMLAIAFTNLTYGDITTWYIVLPLFGSLVCASSAIFYVGSVVKPDLTGGKSSTVYFASISQMSESEFVDKFSKQSDQDLEIELLRQAHRNSEILKEKFEAVGKSLFWTTISTVPWAMFLIVSSVQNSSIARVG